MAPHHRIPHSGSTDEWSGRNGVSHVPKATTSSSNRQKAAFIKAAVTTATSVKRAKKNKARRAKLKAKKQALNLLRISHPVPSQLVDPTREGIVDAALFIDGGNPNNPPICPLLNNNANKKNRPIITIPISALEVPILHLPNANKGLIYKVVGLSSNIILVPRSEALVRTCALNNLKNSISLCTALDAVEDSMRSSQERGGAKNVIRDKKRKYSCVGTQSCRASTGIRQIHYALSKTDPIHQERILKYFSGVEHLFEMYIDTDQIRLIREAITLVDAKTFTIPSRKVNLQTRDAKSSRIYGAFASGVNVYLNSHSDKDFTYCATSIHMREEYTLTHKIVAYFAFPKLGLAIPLRPGDVLFFNPKEEHCISSRCDNKDDIYCMSLYLKSDNIGLNDNSIPLSQTEELLLNQYNTLKK